MTAAAPRPKSFQAVLAYFAEPATRATPGGIDFVGWIAIAALIAGLSARLLLFNEPFLSNTQAGEATRVAQAFAAGRGYADAYFDGQGPTTHILPIMPTLAGSIYWVFGIGTRSASAVLLALALVQTSLAYAMVYKLYRRLAYSRLALLCGLAILSLPLFVRDELKGWRWWEGGFVVALSATVFWLLAPLLEGRSLRNRDVDGVGAAGALTFCLNPIVGLAIGCGALVILLRNGRRYIVRTGIAAALVGSVIIVPWTVRNATSFGHFIPLRANFGLELAIGNYAGALKPDYGAQDYLARMSEVHPLLSKAAAREIERSGEVAYFARLQSETVGWIVDNPSGFATLYLRHLRDFFLPSSEFADLWERASIRTAIGVIVPPVMLLGMMGLFTRYEGNRTEVLSILTFVIVTSLLYALVQPVMRYTYTCYLLLVFPACHAVTDIALKFARSPKHFGKSRSDDDRIDPPGQREGRLSDTSSLSCRPPRTATTFS